MSFTEALDRDAARLREDFGPEHALQMVRMYGLSFCVTYAIDQRMVLHADERDLLEMIPHRRWRSRREVRRCFRMYRDECDRRRELCMTVAWAWGLE